MIRAVRGPHRGLAVLLVAVVAVVVLAAFRVRLTPDGTRYRLQYVGTRLIVRNPADGGGNEREVLWAASTPVASSATECARWQSGTGLTQNGIAFRIRPSHGGWDAVVLERNVWLEGFWEFVVINFHTGHHHNTFDTLAGTNLKSYLGRKNVFPLRVCAEMTGHVLSFAVAKGSDPMPPPGPGPQGASFDLQGVSLPGSGATGTYIAHLPPGSVAVVKRVTIDGQPAPSPLR